MPDSTLWISEGEVVQCIDLADALEILGRAFVAEGVGRAQAMEKTMAAFSGGGTLHSLGAAFEDVVGVKSWAHTTGGADPVLLLMDSDNGALVAVIEAFALGQLRTAATAGLATDLMAAPDASALAVIGTGKQALGQVAAVAAVRPISRVRVYSPTTANRDAFAGRVEAELRLPCQAAPSVSDAVDGADIVTLVTRAKSPVLTDEMVRPRLHINAVGAIDLARREFSPSILGTAEIVATDSVSQTMRLSAEFREWYGESVGDWTKVRSLGELVRGDTKRSATNAVTLFKGMGSGVEDVALGREILERAVKNGLGHSIGRGGRRRPVLYTDRNTEKGGGIKP